MIIKFILPGDALPIEREHHGQIAPGDRVSFEGVVYIVTSVNIKMGHAGEGGVVRLRQVEAPTSN